jgi:hypothetical protein
MMYTASHCTFTHAAHCIALCCTQQLTTSMISLIPWCQGTRPLLYSWYAVVIWAFPAYLCNITSTCGMKSVKAQFGLPMQAGHDVHRRIVPGLHAARHHGWLWMLCTHLGGAWLCLEPHSCALPAGHHDCCHCKAASSALALLVMNFSTLCMWC